MVCVTWLQPSQSTWLCGTRGPVKLTCLGTHRTCGRVLKTSLCNNTCRPPPNSDSKQRVTWSPAPSKSHPFVRLLALKPRDCSIFAGVVHTCKPANSDQQGCSAALAGIFLPGNLGSYPHLITNGCSNSQCTCGGHSICPLASQERAGMDS